MGPGHLTSQPLKNSSKQERNIQRQATTKYMKNKGMHSSKVLETVGGTQQMCSQLFLAT